MTERYVPSSQELIYAEAQMTPLQADLSRNYGLQQAELGYLGLKGYLETVSDSPDNWEFIGLVEGHAITVTRQDSIAYAQVDDLTVDRKNATRLWNRYFNIAAYLTSYDIANCKADLSIYEVDQKRLAKTQGILDKLL